MASARDGSEVGSVSVELICTGVLECCLRFTGVFGIVLLCIALCDEPCCRISKTHEHDAECDIDD